MRNPRSNHWVEYEHPEPLTPHEAWMAERKRYSNRLTLLVDFLIEEFNKKPGVPFRRTIRQEDLRYYFANRPGMRFPQIDEDVAASLTWSVLGDAAVIFSRRLSGAGWRDFTVEVRPRTWYRNACLELKAAP